MVITCYNHSYSYIIYRGHNIMGNPAINLGMAFSFLAPIKICDFGDGL